MMKLWNGKYLDEEDLDVTNTHYGKKYQIYLSGEI